MNTRSTKILALVLSLLIASIACGGDASSDSGTLVQTAETSVDVSAEEKNEDSGPTLFRIGDLVEIDDHQIALSSIDLNGSLLKATFVIKNGGSEEISVSSLLSFSAKNQDAESLEQEIFDCGPGIDGSIVGGDVVSGSVCWQNGSFPARIYYDPSLFGSGTVVWEVAEAGEASIELDAEISQSYAIGDVIEIRDHTISLVEASIQNERLTATFVIENQSNEEMTISTLLSFDVKNADGQSLTEDIFDCEPSLGGTLVGGDRSRGNICWTGAAYPLTIYYDASLLGSGTIVWQLEE